MLSERQLEAMLEVFRKRMQSVTEEYLTRMGEHLRDIGNLKDSDVNRLVEMKRLNANMEQIKREIAKAAQMSIKDVEKVFLAVAESDLRFANKIYASDHNPAIKANPALERILKAQAKITKQELANLSQTTLLSEGYRDAVDVAVQTVQGGIVDYNSAIRRAMKTAAQEGLRVQYPNSGLTRRLDSAVRMNVLDGVRSLNQDIMRQVGKEFGADGVEISAHALCAEDHLPYQGTQMSIKEFERLQNRLDRPFGMWNCHHSWHYIIMGISEPAYDPEELEGFKRNSREEITIDGITKTRYEWTQEQRRIETAIRYNKDIAIAAKASGDMMTRRECAYVIQQLSKRYEKVSEAAGLIEKPERMRVAGFRRVKPLDQLKNTPKYGIMNTGNGKVYMRIMNAQGEEKYRYLKTDVIQKLDSFEAIKRYFTYDDKYGDTYSPIASEFALFKFDIQKEIAEGIEWARKTYSLSVLPNSITRGQTLPKAIGTYNSSTRKLTFRPSTKIDESFVTAVHEMTHFANSVYKIDAEYIFTQALKNIGLRKGSPDAQDIQHATVGYFNRTNDWNDPEELVAYSLERQATNKENKLSAEISRLWLERIAKS